jgi:hypothetical protein
LPQPYSSTLMKQPEEKLRQTQIVNESTVTYLLSINI